MFGKVSILVHCRNISSIKSPSIKWNKSFAKFFLLFTKDICSFYTLWRKRKILYCYMNKYFPIKLDNNKLSRVCNLAFCCIWIMTHSSATMNVWLLQVSAVIHVFSTLDSFHVLHNKWLFPSAAYLSKCNLNAFVNCTLIVCFHTFFFTLGQSQSQWRVNTLSFKTVKKLLVIDLRKPGLIMCRHRKVLVREMLLNLTV